ncbi:hypothetical protein [Stutzerimonas stutzeri]|uniref:hypothetical protein n=1 Tax=Stutzerimonas stutzeri TaxID=316 RepID=UPI0021094644|nr:hypothetical protein [Stutzerimonas stutzeri]MCQ4242393.1 hypothetical protein [Stutzerimonas stutzeri]
MSNKQRTDRIRQQDAKRQQALRNRRAEKRARVGAEVMKLTTYQGTRADLELMQQVGGFEEVDEVITLGIRYLAAIARRHPDAFLAAMDPRNPQ